MKTTFEKQMDGVHAKEPGAFRVSRTRGGKKRVALFGTKDIWRALSSASLSLPETPILRRLRD
jgi:hypothetical protein